MKVKMKLHPIDFKVEGLTLRGSVYEPAGGIQKGKKYPTAILFHGFGGNRVDFSQFLVQMAQSVSAAGLVVVAYDRAGHGESDGDFFNTSVSLDVRQAKQVVTKVAQLDFVDSDNLHFGGISLGAVIGAITAAECEYVPRSIVMCSSAAVFVDEIASGKIQGRSIDGLKTVGYFDFNGLKMGPAMVDDAATIDVYARTAPYSGDVLIMHGTKDLVPLIYAQRYKDLFGSHARLLVREGADHGWSTIPDREFVMSNTAEFMARHAGLRD